MSILQELEEFIADFNSANATDILMLDRIIFYNEAFKSGLQGILCRIEAKISIPNFKALGLPFYEFKSITDIVRGTSHD